ncbi:MAG: DNA translocase FtsK [Clostridia bacterium]|nr:DNA translocase FtsK [Clostridia bacterium]
MIMCGGLDTPTISTVFHIGDYWYTDRTVAGGGVLGGILGGLFYVLMHGWVSVLILVLLLTALVFFYLRLTPKKLFAMIKEAKAKRDKEEAERKELQKVAETIRKENETPDEAPKSTTPFQPIGIEFYTDAVATEIKTETPAPKKETPSVPPTPLDSDTKDEPLMPKITVFQPSPETKASVSEEILYQFNKIPDEADDDSTFNNTDFGYGVDDDDDITLNTVPADTKDAFSNDKNATVIPTNDPTLIPDDALDELDELIDEEDDSPIIGAPPVDKPQSTYTFPPIELLAKGSGNQQETNREELLKNGQKLVDVLKSFRVDTEIVNISCGPTVTRYELAPQSGVRVRAIANLVDDIALNLETSGVRIEAPIPGKAAVGVEVPNKEAATVYLRDLIESEAFRNAKSKLTACVGMDVSGAPILMDIAKMPHLLIAGATGMGKSVGVNSIIMSLLYKATPSELKLILVDPKKVELNMYNKLPHLLIPVVNNPKKAAGALATAVAEMERRFELIESVGARNLKGYNKIIENDPTKEQLPSIVIIIDELADLMMTAKDDVEDSICRIAQKARAAGIHLIICTQRPSVDVITGLIKANVPSRIAFTVASNIDSRTIIDVAGAEKLIGRGDMLFAPVGAMKPIRVQGAFVDDKEVEEVTNFIKNQSKDVKYDDSFLNQVEIEAERCGQQKKKVAADDEIGGDDDLDPKFYEAVELAVDMGKISTSLLQRKLSLGYGRAAKIIDSMEAMGIVGAPDGSKPRNVLISRAEYQEMIMRKSDTPPQ